MTCFLRGLLLAACSLPLSAVAVEEEISAAERSQLEVITTKPADARLFTVDTSVNHDGDGEGEEMPPSIGYFLKGSKDYTTSMTVTDTSLCKRPAEQQICKAFRGFSEVRHALGDEISYTRIGGSGFVTIFLARLDSKKIAGFDSSVAFLAVNTQDPPRGDVVLYVFATRRTNLIQLAAPVGTCLALQDERQNDVSYLETSCMSQSLLQSAATKLTALTGLFRVEPR